MLTGLSSKSLHDHAVLSFCLLFAHSNMTACMFTLIAGHFHFPAIWLIIALRYASYILNEQHASADGSYMCHFYAEPWKEAMVHGVPTAKADSVLTRS